MFAAIDRESRSAQFPANNGRIFHVETDQGFHFLLASVGINGFSATLNDVADAVELRALSSVPETPEFDLFTVGGFAFQALGHHREGASRSGESGVLRKGPEFNGAVPCAFDFEDRVGQIGVLDERLVGGIKQDQCPIAAGVVNPGFELCLGGHSTGGVVGEAEIDQIDRFIRDLGGEVIGGTDGQIAQSGVAALVTGVTGPASHDIAIHVDGVHRIGDRDTVPFAKDVKDVAAVALRSVGDKDLVGADVAAAGLEVMGCDRFTQPAVALLRAIAVEAFGGSHLIDGLFHRLAAGQWQRLGDITDPKPNQCRIRIGAAERFDAPCNFREQVARLELEVVAVDLHHGTIGRMSSGASCPVGRALGGSIR